MSRRRLLLFVFTGIASLALGGAIATRRAVVRAAYGRILDTKHAPPRPVAIVFGAAVGSSLLRDRVATGAALYHAHKVRHLLLSGDNRRRSYDEPNAMRRLALEAGVPDAAIVLDYAGRRTYDSCARARQMQAELSVPFLFENVSYYAELGAAEMSEKQLQKIEELYLHIIQMNNKMTNYRQKLKCNKSKFQF